MIASVFGRLDTAIGVNLRDSVRTRPTETNVSVFFYLPLNVIVIRIHVDVCSLSATLQ